jgi:L-amino acid N-acyltransferase YncA
MNPLVLLQPVEEKDVHEITALYNYYVENSTATFSINSFTEDEMRKLLFFDNPLYRSFTIRCGGIMAGYGIVSNFKKREAYDTTAEITIYLKPESSGKGIGTPALTLLENFAKSVNLHVLISTVCAENIQSLRLFEKNGYTRCAHYKEIGRKFERFLDIIILEKIIS